MRKNPEKRLGSGPNDSDEVMRQAFFKVMSLSCSNFCSCSSSSSSSSSNTVQAFFIVFIFATLSLMIYTGVCCF